MPPLPDLLVQCAAALLTFVLGWLLPPPQRILRALLTAAEQADREKKEKP